MMRYLGEVYFRANDSTDRFITVEVWEADDEFANDTDPSAGVNGESMLVIDNMPQFKEVSVAGDTAIIKAWFRSANAI